MSDARLRELQRRFEQSKSVEDEAAWLLARVKFGDLEQENLEIAAYCSHPAARKALNGKPASTDEWRRNILWSPRLSLRVAIISANHALRQVERRVLEDLCPTEVFGVTTTLLRHVESDSPRELIRWSSDLCRKLAEMANDVAYRIADRDSIPERRNATYAAWAAEEACYLAGSYDCRLDDEKVDRATRACVAAANATSLLEVHTAISSCIIPWAIGYGDPLLDPPTD